TRVEAILGLEAERDGKLHLLATEAAKQQTLHQAAEGRAARLRGTAGDLAGAEATLRRIRSVQEAAMQEASRLQVTLADLNGHIRTRSEDAVEEAWREAA